MATSTQTFRARFEQALLADAAYAELSSVPTNSVSELSGALKDREFGDAAALYVARRFAAPAARRGRESSTSTEHAQRARATGAPWAAVSSASRTARIPPAGLNFPRRNRLLQHWATVTEGRRRLAVQLHCRQQGL